MKWLKINEVSMHVNWRVYMNSLITINIGYKDSVIVDEWLLFSGV